MEEDLEYIDEIPELQIIEREDVEEEMDYDEEYAIITEIIGIQQ